MGLVLYISSLSLAREKVWARPHPPLPTGKFLFFNYPQDYLSTEIIKLLTKRPVIHRNHCSCTELIHRKMDNGFIMAGLCTSKYWS